jgi:hypothetical protein
MTTVTLEVIEARQNELAELIAKFKAEAAAPIGPVLFLVPEAQIELQPGERYAGAVLGDDGKVSHHLVLLPPHPEERMTWANAIEWARGVGGTLPTRQEQSLLFANLKGQFSGDWYWSSEQHAGDGAYAWSQGFDDGTQDSSHTSYEGRVRAVRRVTA